MRQTYAKKVVRRAETYAKKVVISVVCSISRCSISNILTVMRLEILGNGLPFIEPVCRKVRSVRGYIVGSRAIGGLEGCD